MSLELVAAVALLVVPVVVIGRLHERWKRRATPTPTPLAEPVVPRRARTRSRQLPGVDTPAIPDGTVVTDGDAVYLMRFGRRRELHPSDAQCGLLPPGAPRVSLSSAVIAALPLGPPLAWEHMIIGRLSDPTRRFFLVRNGVRRALSDAELRTFVAGGTGTARFGDETLPEVWNATPEALPLALELQVVSATNSRAVYFIVDGTKRQILPDPDYGARPSIGAPDLELHQTPYPPRSITVPAAQLDAMPEGSAIGAFDARELHEGRTERR